MTHTAHRPTAQPRGFRDLDHDGVMAPYENPALSPEDRAADLLPRMTIEEKAALLFHTMIEMTEDGALVEGGSLLQPLPTSRLVAELGLSHFNLVGGGSPRAMARWHNHLQALAEQSRLGIPVTVSSDPRHHFTENPLATAAAGAFSEWPEPTGLAAIGDPALVERFADTVRREYLAVGIRVALHPQADLATEPRWGRISGTFGEDAELASRLVRSYIRGLQGATVGRSSVSAMVKHFPGAGPQQDGEDAHFSYGREQVYPGGNFDYHLAPFRAAIEAGAAQIMPYYGMPVGTRYEEVGFGFSKEIITGLLRGELGFDGIVCSDWGLVTDAVIAGQILPARAWGVEQLSAPARIQRILAAGVDQFGGECCPELVVDLVRSGAIPESRIDESARRMLRLKFALGLFDDPYVDADAAEQIAGSPDLRAAGLEAQSRAVTVLTNDGLLPLSRGIRIYAPGFDPAEISAYGQSVDDPRQADVALIRTATPYEPRSGPLESYFHAGRLDFSHSELAPMLALAADVPTIIAIYLERPAVIPELAGAARALLADFGAQDAAVLRAVFGDIAPAGRLPFELPRSVEEVHKQRSDVPRDTTDPLFSFGHGLPYPPRESQ
jgi:beta-glucosidase